MPSKKVAFPGFHLGWWLESVTSYVFFGKFAEILSGLTLQSVYMRYCKVCEISLSPWKIVLKAYINPTVGDGLMNVKLYSDTIQGK